MILCRMPDDLSPDAALEELAQEPGLPATRPGPKKLNYSHEALVDLMIQNPWMTQRTMAAAFGYTESWVCNIIASDAFQAKLAARREEIVDPGLKASLAERARGLVLQSINILQRELEKPQVPPNVALRAFELGAKAVGMGGNAAPAPPPAPAADRLVHLAERLTGLLSQPREGVVINGEAKVVNEEAFGV